MEPLGPKIRRQRRRLGFTLDELAGRAGISKPYLSLIETGRVSNPPSDGKLRRLEQTLDFKPGELLTQAHLQRTPREVRAVLQSLLLSEARRTDAGGGRVDAEKERADAGTRRRADAKAPVSASPCPRVSASPLSPASVLPGGGVDLDEALLTGVLQTMVKNAGCGVEPLHSGVVPVINRVSAGYPQDFTDLGFPPRVADAYLTCPDVHDRDAFAARVHGDSMTPKYSAGDIVIFSPALPPREGDDCFVRFADGRTTFQRAFFENGEDAIPLIRLQPRNERYRAQTVAAEEIAGLYRAIYQYQKVDEKT